MNLHNDTWAAESAIDYFHHEERGKPTIFWKSEQLEIYGILCTMPEVFSCDASHERNLAHFPQFRDKWLFKSPVKSPYKVVFVEVPPSVDSRW